MTVAVLEDPEQLVVRFDDRSFRWIDVKRFPWDGLGDDREVLGSLIGHRHYRDSPDGLGATDPSTEAVHGPYRLANLSPRDFQPMTRPGAQAVVAGFLALPPSPPSLDVLWKVEWLVLPRLRSGCCYRLPRLPLAEHDFAFAMAEYRELVAISRGTGEVILVVMAID